MFDNFTGAHQDRIITNIKMLVKEFPSTQAKVEAAPVRPSAPDLGF